MSTYEIVPLTSSSDSPYKIENNIGIEKCRKICNKDHEMCLSYQYTYDNTQKSSKCLFFNKKLQKTSHSSDSTLYIKKSNPSYWILWLFLACLLFIILFSRCGKKRF